MHRRSVGCLAFGLLLVFVANSVAFVVSAEAPPTSTNYRFDESSITGGGLIEANSNNFRSSSSLGDTAVGNSASDNFQTESGSQTTDDPALTFIIEDGDATFNDFSATAAATATTSFSIINYTAYGYVVHIAGTAPSNGAHVIDAMGTTTPDSSTPGSEQFGINLVANTSPISFGANPDHGQFGFGSAETNYDTANMYRFVNGEAIASAPKTSGRTLYTISYIVNVDTLTPGGTYIGDQTIIVTGTY